MVPGAGTSPADPAGTRPEQVLESLRAGAGGGEQPGPGKERKGTGVEEKDVREEHYE